MGIVKINKVNNNSDNKNNEINNKERPWKIMLQNMEGLVTENSKEKIDYLKEYVKEDNIILLNLTETWLDSTIKEDAEIEGYKILEVIERIEFEVAQQFTCMINWKQINYVK